MDNPFTTALFAWQTGTVFALRSLQLWTEPAQAQARLTAYALEKQKAFAAGALAASQAAMTGAATWMPRTKVPAVSGTIAACAWARVGTES